MRWAFLCGLFLFVVLVHQLITTFTDDSDDSYLPRNWNEPVTAPLDRDPNSTSTSPQAFFQTQQRLLESLPTGTHNRAHWDAYYARNDAPLPSRARNTKDDLIYAQLKDRGVCKALGKRPIWSREDLIEGLRDFTMNVWPNRPLKNNNLGMGYNHAFLAWLYAKRLKPDYIVENGIHWGQSTWMLRQASPNAKIFSFDPKASIIKYWDKQNTYWVGDSNFKGPNGVVVHPFVDFNDIDWDELIPDKTNALILFDDHQNHLKRLKQMKAKGFRHAMFDDNWPELQGDNYSLKQICDETGGRALHEPGFQDTRVLVCDNFHMSDYFITAEEHQANRKLMHDLVKIYFEGPPPLFHPRHLEFTKFGHKPRKDTTSYQLVLPKPSNRLLEYMAHELIPASIIQSQQELEYVQMERAGLTQDDFGGHGCPCFVELK